MRPWLIGLTILMLASLGTPAFAQKGFGSKGNPEAKIRKLEADLKKTQDELQALQKELGKGKPAAAPDRKFLFSGKDFKGKPSDSDLDKKRAEFKKLLEGKKPGKGGPKKLEDMKKFGWAGKGFGRPGFGKSGFPGMMPFGGFKKPDFKKADTEKKPDFKKPDFKKPDFKKDGAPGRPGPSPAAKDASTDQLLRQILEELRQMRKEQPKFKR